MNDNILIYSEWSRYIYEETGPFQPLRDTLYANSSIHKIESEK